MVFTDFLVRYGSTERRRYLIGLLEAELVNITLSGWAYRAFVFGSLVNSEKEEPGDIDILLCISKPFASPFWRKISATDDIHIKPCQLSSSFDPAATAPQPLPPCHGAEEMVRLFNESTRNTEEDIEISVDQCVEVIL
jgi:hypothetical protein